MEVTYNTTRADLFRSSLVFLRFGPLRHKFWQIPVLSMFVAGLPKLLFGDFVGVLPIGISTFILFPLLISLMLPIAVLIKLPTRKSRRPCTTYINPDGYIDTMPEKETAVNWLDCQRIMETSQDFYFFAPKGQGCYVPKRAFATPDEADRFLTTAQAYWNAARTGTPLPADVPDDGVWPPAPRTL